MSDEEFFVLLMMVFYSLEQSRQRRMHRMMLLLSAYIQLSNLHMQLTAMRFFMELYSDREAWSFHRQYNEFDVYFAADLNTSKDLDPDYWQKHYRICRETFDNICSLVHEHMVKNDTQLRSCIPLPKRVAIAIWWLANGESYRSIGQTFGVSTSILGYITKDFVGALVNIRHRFIMWPQSEEQSLKCVASFENLSSLPNVFGAIDGTHIHIQAPEESTVDFFDRKQRHSIGVQGVCDGNLKFLNVAAGFPGSVHDGRILRNTWVYKAACDGDILRSPVFKLTNAVAIRPFLVGDAAYPISDWLIKPYTYDTSMNQDKSFFNLSLSQARVSIDRAFGVLKGRWRLLLGKVCLEPSYVADIVVACCVLHNICQEKNEQLVEIPDPYVDNSSGSEKSGGSGEELRSFLCKYICNLEEE